MKPEWTFSAIVIDHMARNGYTAFDMLGRLPDMLNDADPLPAVNQFDRGYAHGGGWRNHVKFASAGETLIYPGDPPMRKIAETQLRDERIVLYESSWVAVIQPDGSFDVARMD